MKPIVYFDQKDRAGQQEMCVQDYDRDHLRVDIGGESVVLNATQVDKLRQQFHGWLHERANGPGGANWRELG